jgi:peptidoglycan hydrolase CwlO-like protein
LSCFQTNAISQKKKAEGQVSDVNLQLEEVQRQREDISKQLKRAQQQINTIQTESEDAKAERDRIVKELREAERK